jgi:hypothetical protein
LAAILDLPRFQPNGLRQRSNDRLALAGPERIHFIDDLIQFDRQQRVFAIALNVGVRVLTSAARSCNGSDGADRLQLAKA